MAKKKTSPQIEWVKIESVKSTLNNPRIIKEKKFQELVKSIEELPSMSGMKPIMVDELNVVIAGNQRLAAYKSLKWDEVPITIFTREYAEEANKKSIKPKSYEDQCAEMVIKDNLHAGEWDWDVLANEWKAEDLGEWGLTVWNPTDIDLDQFFEENKNIETDRKTTKLVFEYSDDEYEKVIHKIKELGNNKEAVLYKLLGL